MKFKIDWKGIDKKWKAYTLAGLICVAAYLLLTNLGHIFSGLGKFLSAFNTVFIGAVIAYIFDPLAKLFDRSFFKKMKNRKVAWVLSVVVTLVFVFAFISVPLVLLIPQLTKSIVSFFNNLGTYAQNLASLAESLDPRLKELVDSAFEYYTAEGGVLNTIGKTIQTDLSAVINTTASISTVATNWVIGIIFSIYFLLNKKAILNAFRRFFSVFFSPNQYVRASELSTRFNSIFSKYIICELVDSLIIGVATAVFMACLGMPNIILVSVIAAVANLVPTFGPIIGAVVAGLILLLAAPQFVVAYIIFTLASQLVDAYIIKPKLFGDMLNVPGVLILVAVIVFGKLMGLVGMLLAIPFAGILTYLYSELLIPWLAKKHEKEKESEARETEEDPG